MARVFISYSHDSLEHKARVNALAQRLRTDGITTIIDSDLLPGGPADGWPRWSERQVKEADLVLVVCTAIYYQRFQGDQLSGGGLGAVVEAGAIRQFLYDQASFNEKVRAIVFGPDDYTHIPRELKRYSSFLLDKQEGYANLLVWIRDRSPIAPPHKLETPTVRWPSPAPDYEWHIADRRDPIAVFQKMVTGQIPQRILLLPGASGTGKSILLSEFFAYSRHLNLAAASLDFKGCPSLDEVFEALRLDLGPDILGESYPASGMARFYQFISDLQHLSLPLVLFFDTYEQASVDTQKWIEGQLLPRLDRTRAVVVVISGQLVPNDELHPWRTLVESRELTPIAQSEDWLEFSRRKWEGREVKADYVKALTLATGGNPGQMSALLETLIRQETD